VQLLERTTLIKAPRADVFGFFEDPHNLWRITPAWINLRISAIDPLPIKANFRIEYRMRWLGFGSFKWVTLISDYQPPRYFADEQESGLYKYWRHVHTFDDVEGGTLMRDRVQYELRFGILGVITDRLIVARQLRAIFDYRNRQLRKIFATAKLGA
jgi:ligand-binding SRPBCC domain-containing protein